MKLSLTNVSNLAVFGVEWTLDGTTFQLFTVRGLEGLELGIRRDGGQWSSAPVVRPERFGVTGPVRSWKQFKAIADRFIDSV